MWQSYTSARSKYYAYSVLWGVTIHSQLRQAAIGLVEWPWFDRISLTLIMLNVVTMMMDDPLAPVGSTPMSRVFLWIDAIVSILLL